VGQRHRRRRQRSGRAVTAVRIGGLILVVLAAAVTMGRVTALGSSPGVAQAFGAANTTAGTSLAATPSPVTGGGDLLIASIKVRDTTALATVTGVADSAGNVWVKAAAVTEGAQADGEIWYAQAATSVSSVTVSVSGTSALAFTVLDVTGASSSPLDRSATLAGSSTAPSTGTTTATSQANEIVIGGLGWNGTATPSGQTSGYSTTAVRQSTASGVATGEQAAWQIVSSTGTQTYAATLSSSVAWTGAIATFRVGSSGPPPVITSFSPSSGVDGASVTINGSGFTGATAVKFNGTNQPAFTVNSDIQITTTVPTGATTGPITVTSGLGVTGSSTTSFTVLPSITTFSPSSGPVGTSVTINGSGFTGLTGVTFTSGVAATTFAFVSDAKVTATAPSGTSTGPISVTTHGGISTPSSTSFTVTTGPPPTVITGFSPTSGPVGTPVTISGSGFTGATSVKFHGIAATFTVTSDLQISTTVPATATTGVITVTAPGGTATSSTAFTVTVTAAAPHVMVIMMENKAYSSAQGKTYIVGSANAPYINNTLIKNYTSATKWFGVVHGSPNDYLDTIAGFDQNLGHGGTRPFTAPTIADELNAANIRWKAYMESMPSNCYQGVPTTLYSSDHNPFAYFSDYTSLCDKLGDGVVPYNGPFTGSQMQTDLNSASPPAYIWFSPNVCDDMHTNGSPCGANGVANGDTWMSTFIPGVQATNWYKSGGIIILTWDESVSTDTSGGVFGNGGHVATLIIDGTPKGAYTSSGDEYATLRGIEEKYGIGLLGNSSSATFGDIKTGF